MNTLLSKDEKQAIKEDLQKYVERFPSQTKAAQSLTGTSSATVSTILSGKWDLISDEMWRKVQSQVCSGSSSEWQYVETGSYKEMQFVMDDAKTEKNVTWIVGDAGCGKTTAAKLYAEENKNVYLIQCSEDFRKSDFVREIARKIGLRTEGLTVRETLSAIISQVIQTGSPLLLFDEADKLAEPVFHYFIDLYNRLEGRCGIVFFSTSYIKRRMEMGLRYNKQGYNEIHSRIGRKFFELEQTTAQDVYAVCIANGLKDKKEINEVVRDAEEYDFDLRRVKKAIHRVKKMNK